jgi:hypothetical protein
MSRSGYSDGCDDSWAMIMWRGRVASATRGKRGQAMFRELLEALDAMPEKRLISEELELDGSFCTLGVLGHKRGLDMTAIDPEEYDKVSEAFEIPQVLAREIVFMNDDAYWSKEDPEHRWERMRKWVVEQIEYGEKMAQRRKEKAK